MESLGVIGNEETFSEQQLRDRLRHLDSCIKSVASCKADHNLPPAKRDGVEQLLGYLCRLDMTSRAILRLKLYGRMTNTMPEDMEELSVQLLHLDNAHCFPFESHSYSLRGHSSEELSRRVTKWREEIAKEQPRYDALLILFGIEQFGFLLPGEMSTNKAAPCLFRSPWKQLISLALQQLGSCADYKKIANWIADNHHRATLPSYCDEFERESVDIGWLVVHSRKVAGSFMRDITSVRARMAPKRNSRRPVKAFAPFNPCGFDG
jgi:hypothetical protein